MSGCDLVLILRYRKAVTYGHHVLLAALEEHATATSFPLSVDGIEIVASLVLLADKRAARRSGWLPWAAHAHADSLPAGLVARQLPGLACSPTWGLQ